MFFKKKTLNWIRKRNVTPGTQLLGDQEITKNGKSGRGTFAVAMLRKKAFVLERCPLGGSSR